MRPWGELWGRLVRELFDWDDGNWPKCGKHGLTKLEIETAFEAPSARFVPLEHATEVRWMLVAFNDGRWMSVIFTRRNDRVRPISAKPMHLRDVRRHVT